MTCHGASSQFMQHHTGARLAGACLHVCSRHLSVSLVCGRLCGRSAHYLTMPSKPLLVGFFCAGLFVSACGKEEFLLPSFPDPACPDYGSTPSADAPDPATPLPLEVARELIGFTEAEAEICAASLGWSFRVAVRDGEHLPLTKDYMTNRVNVFVNDGKVSEVYVG